MKKEYRSFEDARKFVQALGLKNQKGWTAFCKLGKKPDNIPTDAYHVFKNKGWISWGDWTGTNVIATYKIKYRSYGDARKFAQSLGIKNANEWREFAKSGKLPNDIPANPWKTYSEKRKKK